MQFLKMSDGATNVVVSEDFFPRIGGAHSWLYETYRRWRTPVRVLTARYSADAQIASQERAFDGQDHGRLSILRERVPAASLGLNAGTLRSLLGGIRSLRRIAGRAPLVLHTLRAFPDGFLAALYKKVHRRSTVVVTYAHGEEILIAKTSRQLAYMARVAYASSDLVIVNSENTRRMLLEFCPGVRCVCIHPGVDVESFRAAADEVTRYRAAWGWPAGTVVLATLARMEARKNHAMCIRVLARLRAEGLPLALVCAGDGEHRQQLGRLAEELRMSEWIRFPGRVSETQKRLLLNACDIFAMPSIQIDEMIEGFGIVFLEAGAAGKPVIGGNSGGQPEAIRHGETGFVVDGADEADVAAAVRALVNDAKLRHEMGERGRAWASGHGWDAVAERTRLAIERLADDATKGTAA